MNRLYCLALIAAQLLAGSSGPLYLCIDAEGQVCGVDRGAGHCHCQHHDEHEAPASQWRDAPCGCTHLPLSLDLPQLVGRRSSLDVVQMSAPPVVTLLPAWADQYSVEPGLATAWIPGSQCGSGAARAGITLLRC